MRWKGRRQSDAVEDRRGQGMGRPLAIGGIGTLVVIGIALFLGADPSQILNMLGQMQGAGPAATEQGPAPGNDEARQFVATVLADTEEVWGDIFEDNGRTYQRPRLILYSGRTEMPGGVADAATGPFYYPTDQTVYLDFSFFDEMKHRLNAPGDFAAAYVITHEVGHHVQHLLGVTERVQTLRQRVPEVEANQLLVRLELQADFYAGVWAYHAQQRWNIIEEGDVEEALNAANAIGDDRLQKQARGVVVPDAFTHGTSAQRVRWFTKGLRGGDPADGDTFSVPYEQL